MMRSVSCVVVCERILRRRAAEGEVRADLEVALTRHRAWRRDTAEALACDARHKPRDLAAHTWQVTRLLGKDTFAGEVNLLAMGFALAAVPVGIGGRRLSRNQFRGRLVPALMLLVFNTIPAMAFYAALPTLAGFHVALPLCAGLLVLRAVVPPRV
jgi:hypothetical protein